MFHRFSLLVNVNTFLHPRTKPQLTDDASEYFVLFHHKVIVACAVEVRHRKPGTAQDKRKDGRSACYRARPEHQVALWIVEKAVAPGTVTVTDDWSGYASLRKRGYRMDLQRCIPFAPTRANRGFRFTQQTPSGLFESEARPRA